MQIIFKKPGKYRDTVNTIIVSDEDVKTQKTFVFNPGNAVYFINAGLAVEAKAEKEIQESFDLGALTLSELKEFAVANKIDIGEATKKKEILEIVEKSLTEIE